MQNPSSLYDDSGGEQPATTPEPGGEKESSGGQTALVPKSVFGRELKPGDKCDIEVVRVHEDAYEVQGCEGGGEQEQEAPAESPAPEPAGNPMME